MLATDQSKNYKLSGFLNMPTINIATFFHQYGFHRDQGAFPGERLHQKLRPILGEAQKYNEVVTIDLNEMKAFYRSFADGAFGLYIDQLKNDFFSHFAFRSDNNPTYIETIQRVFRDHKNRNFNQNIPT